LGTGENQRASVEFFEELEYAVGVLDGDDLVAWDPDLHTKHNFFMFPAERAPWL
jgi:hypothetical protein